MMLYILKTFLVHLAIIVFYLGITSYWFVTRGRIDPIQTGLQQGLLILFHLICTVMVAVKGNPNIKQKYIVRNEEYCLLLLVYIHSWVLF
jgi:hypothetical protein